MGCVIPSQDNTCCREGLERIGHCLGEVVHRLFHSAGLGFSYILLFFYHCYILLLLLLLLFLPVFLLLSNKAVLMSLA